MHEHIHISPYIYTYEVRPLLEYGPQAFTAAMSACGRAAKWHAALSLVLVLLLSMCNYY